MLQTLALMLSLVSAAMLCMWMPHHRPTCDAILHTQAAPDSQYNTLSRGVTADHVRQQPLYQIAVVDVDHLPMVQLGGLHSSTAGT